MGGLVPMETPPQLALKSCTLVCEADHCEVIIKPLQVRQPHPTALGLDIELLRTFSPFLSSL